VDGANSSVAAKVSSRPVRPGSAWRQQQRERISSTQGKKRRREREGSSLVACGGRGRGFGHSAGREAKAAPA
jgi:hypothetical protein